LRRFLFWVTVEQADIKDAEEVLQAIAQKGSQKLQDTINFVVRVLHNEPFLQQFGVYTENQ